MYVYSYYALRVAYLQSIFQKLFLLHEYSFYVDVYYILKGVAQKVGLVEPELHHIYRSQFEIRTIILLLI